MVQQKELKRRKELGVFDEIGLKWTCHMWKAWLNSVKEEQLCKQLGQKAFCLMKAPLLL